LVRSLKGLSSFICNILLIFVLFSVLPKDKLSAYSRRFSLVFGQVFSLRSRPGGATEEYQLQDIEAPVANAASEREAVAVEDAPPAYCPIMW
jgi:hypothetical protein